MLLNLKLNYREKLHKYNDEKKICKEETYGAYLVKSI